MITQDQLQLKQQSYEIICDEDLVMKIRDGEAEALDFLISKYKNIVHMKIKSYFLIGADKEDIFQEGMIGLYKAVRDFNVDKNVTFKAFADLCIKRQIITAIKTATRQKHMPLNSYVSLDKPIGDDDHASTLMDTLSNELTDDPALMMVNREEFMVIEGQIDEVLSPFEQQVFRQYVDGCSYQEMAEQLGRPMKSIDNALQRIKRKLLQSLTQLK